MSNIFISQLTYTQIFAHIGIQIHLIIVSCQSYNDYESRLETAILSL